MKPLFSLIRKITNIFTNKFPNQHSIEITFLAKSMRIEKIEKLRFEGKNYRSLRNWSKLDWHQNTIGKKHCHRNIRLEWKWAQLLKEDWKVRFLTCPSVQMSQFSGTENENERLLRPWIKWGKSPNITATFISSLGNQPCDKKCTKLKRLVRILGEQEIRSEAWNWAQSWSASIKPTTMQLTIYSR